MLAIAMVSLTASLALAGAARQGQLIDWRATGFRAQGRLLLTNTSVKISLLVTGAATVAMIIHGNFLPVMLDSMGVTATTIGILVSLRAVAAMLVRPVIAGTIQMMGGRGQAILVSLGSLAVGMVYLGFADAVILIGMFSILVGLGSGICQPLSIVILSENVDGTMRSGALGMRLMANRGVNFLAPLAFGAALEWAGFGASFALTGVSIALCAFLVYALVGVKLTSAEQKKPAE